MHEAKVKLFSDREGIWLSSDQLVLFNEFEEDYISTFDFKNYLSNPLKEMARYQAALFHLVHKTGILYEIKRSYKEQTMDCKTIDLENFSALALIPKEIGEIDFFYEPISFENLYLSGKLINTCELTNLVERYLEAYAKLFVIPIYPLDDENDDIYYLIMGEKDDI